MKKFQNYRDLKVWVKAIDLVEECYRITKTFPKHELYGLSSQIQRAAISIPANIAEGWQKLYRKEFIRYLTIAHGSLAELETHLEIAYRLKYVGIEEKDGFFGKTAEIGRMLTGLRLSLKSKLKP